LGDETPRRMGRVTLNPLAHLDPLGSILLIIAGFGWAKPVQVNPYNLRPGPQLGMGIVAAAGPLSNFVMAALAAIPFRLGIVPDLGGGAIIPSVSGLLQEFIYINLILMLFNLIPLPPLDGSKILRAVAPRNWDSLLAPLEQYGPLLLMALVFLGGRFLGVLVGQPALAIFRALVG
jgi:Zn-dependent protease